MRPQQKGIPSGSEDALELSPEEAEVVAAATSEAAAPDMEESLPTTTQEAEAALKIAGQELQAALDEEFGNADEVEAEAPVDGLQVTETGQFEAEPVVDFETAPLEQDSEPETEATEAQDTFQVDLISALQQEIEQPESDIQEEIAEEPAEPVIADQIAEEIALPEESLPDATVEQQAERSSCRN